MTQKKKENERIIDILGHKYKVTEVDGLVHEFGVMGQACHIEEWIRIDASLTKDCKRSTLLHEVLEQISLMNELRLPHKTISILEASLFQVIKSNPGLFS